MLEESNKRSSENHNWLSLDFDTRISLGTLTRIKFIALVRKIGALKGFLSFNENIFLCLDEKFR